LHETTILGIVELDHFQALMAGESLVESLEPTLKDELERKVEQDERVTPFPHVDSCIQIMEIHTNMSPHPPLPGTHSEGFGRLIAVC
jgi:hypothetical protein